MSCNVHGKFDHHCGSCMGLDSTLEIGETDKNGNQYDLIVQYEIAQEAAFLESHSLDGNYGSVGTITVNHKPF